MLSGVAGDGMASYPAPVTTELWFQIYSRKAHVPVVNIGQSTFIMAFSMLNSLRVDPVAWLRDVKMLTPHARLIIIGTENTAYELRDDATLSRPAAVYPVWRYGQELEILEELVEQAVGKDENLIRYSESLGFLPITIPVRGQEHRVIVTALPRYGTPGSIQILDHLAHLQSDHPECIMHIHGPVTFQAVFGYGLAAATVMSKDKLYLPNGQVVRREREVGPEHKKWVELVGYSPATLNKERLKHVYDFNLRSYVWAAKNFNRNSELVVNPTDEDLEVPDAEYVFPVYDLSYRPRRPRGVMPQPGDELMCDMCSLAPTCAFHRSGAVCSIPNTEPASLASHFGTRDASKILDGMGLIVSAMAGRFQRAVVREVQDDAVADEKVTKLGKAAFDAAERMAKLLDPALARAQSGVPLPRGNIIDIPGAPAQLADAYRQLEADGWRREDITREMLVEVLGVEKVQALLAAPIPEEKPVDVPVQLS